MLAAPAPVVPLPESLRTLQEWASDAIELRGEGATRWIDVPPPFEMRMVESPTFLTHAKHAGPRSYWLRLPRPVAADPRVHAALVTYASDYFLVDQAVRNRPDDVGWPELLAAPSVDHAVWLHRPAQLDRWHLYTQQTVALDGDRGARTGSAARRRRDRGNGRGGDPHAPVRSSASRDRLTFPAAVRGIRSTTSKVSAPCRRRVVPAVRAECVGGGGVVVRLDDRRHPMSPLGVRESDDHDVEDVGVFADHRLYFGRVDVGPAGDDHVDPPVGDVDEAVVVDRTHVSEGARTRRGQVVASALPDVAVSGSAHEILQTDLADFAVRNRPTVLVHDPHLGVTGFPTVPGCSSHMSPVVITSPWFSLPP